MLTKKRNLYSKVFRQANYESVLDGEVVQTGAGVVWRKTFRKFKDLFKNKNREERRAEKRRREEDEQLQVQDDLLQDDEGVEGEYIDENEE